jgi:hypothetical protein
LPLIVLHPKTIPNFSRIPNSHRQSLQNLILPFLTLRNFPASLPFTSGGILVPNAWIISFGSMALIRPAMLYGQKTTTPTLYIILETNE